MADKTEAKTEAKTKVATKVKTDGKIAITKNGVTMRKTEKEAKTLIRNGWKKV